MHAGKNQSKLKVLASTMEIHPMNLTHLSLIHHETPDEESNATFTLVLWWQFLANNQFKFFELHC